MRQLRPPSVKIVNLSATWAVLSADSELKIKLETVVIIDSENWTFSFSSIFCYILLLYDLTSICYCMLFFVMCIIYLFLFHKSVTCDLSVSHTYLNITSSHIRLILYVLIIQTLCITTTRGNVNHSCLLIKHIYAYSVMKYVGLLLCKSIQTSTTKKASSPLIWSIYISIYQMTLNLTLGQIMKQYKNNRYQYQWS